MADVDGSARRRSALLLVLLLVLLGGALLRGADRARAAEALLLRLVERPLAAASAALDAARGRVAEATRRERLRERVRALEAQVARLELGRAELEEARRENERLGALLALRERTALPSRAARVVATRSSAGLAALVVDAGSRDGVEPDAPVLAAGGLVGRVLKVGEVTSVVQLLTDAASGVAVLDERSRVQGVLTGAGHVCRLRYVQNLDDVRPGDAIVASGLDGIFPKGVRVGTVAEALPGADAFQVIRVEPAVRPRELETVLVLLRAGRSAPAAPGSGLARLETPRGLAGARP